MEYKKELVDYFLKDDIEKSKEELKKLLMIIFSIKKKH